MKNQLEEDNQDVDGDVDVYIVNKVCQEEGICWEVKLKFDEF